MDNIRKNKVYIKDVYRKIILLAMAAHMLYAIICAIIHQIPLTFYNFGSVLFYFGMLFIINKGCFRIAVSIVHLEVSLFVVVSTLYFGWGSGYSLLLVALTSLVYFSPFKNRVVPYVISLSEVLLFFVLKLIIDQNGSEMGLLHHTVMQGMYLLNAFISFGMILYGAIITKISSHMIEKSLSDENESLYEIANYDQLTGLWTRWHMYDTIHEKRVHPTYVALGDIDDFKLINDQYGHMCGDFVLVNIASIIKDVLFQNVGIVRWGGEEIVLLFEDQQIANVQSMLELIRQRIETHDFIYDGQHIHVTMTFGLSVVDDNIDYALQRADEHMYQGKRSGKNQIIS